MKATKNRLSSVAAAIKKNNYYMILIAALAVIFIVVSIINDSFATLGNIVSMLEQMSEYALMALGIMLCIVAGGIDLSTVGVANLVAALAALSLLKFIPEGCSDTTFAIGIVLVIVGGIVIGVVAGLLNGLLITKLGIPPMLATMAANYVYTGICMPICLNLGRSWSAAVICMKPCSCGMSTTPRSMRLCGISTMTRMQWCLVALVCPAFWINPWIRSR